MAEEIELQDFPSELAELLAASRRMLRGARRRQDLARQAEALVGQSLRTDTEDLGTAGVVSGLNTLLEQRIRLSGVAQVRHPEPKFAAGRTSAIAQIYERYARYLQDPQRLSFIVKSSQRRTKFVSIEAIDEVKQSLDELVQEMTSIEPEPEAADEAQELNAEPSEYARGRKAGALEVRSELQNQIDLIKGQLTTLQGGERPRPADLLRVLNSGNRAQYAFARNKLSPARRHADRAEGAVNTLRNALSAEVALDETNIAIEGWIEGWRQLLIAPRADLDPGTAQVVDDLLVVFPELAGASGMDNDQLTRALAHPMTGVLAVAAGEQVRSLSVIAGNSGDFRLG